MLNSLEYIPANLKICNGYLFLLDNFFQVFSADSLLDPFGEVGLVVLFSFTHSPLWSPYTLVADK